MIQFKTDIGHTVTVTKDQFKKIIVEEINHLFLGGYYDLDDISPIMLAENLTGFIGQEHGLGGEEMQLIEEVYNNYKA